MSVAAAETPSVVKYSFAVDLIAVADSVNATLDDLLPVPVGDERRVVDAMRYAALNGGKRLRPFLVIGSAALFGVSRVDALRAAAAIEMVHCYSLVHDDLPAMDNDDLRRGRATVHKAYDDATAILAGDGLLTQAFAVLADPATHDVATVRIALISVLAEAAGAAGMVGGQMLDLLVDAESLSPEDVERLQSLKTGSLLSAACELGAILGHAPDQERDSLRCYGISLGAAFQIADDLLDVEATADEAGKSTGKDGAAGKGTFVSLYGPERARTQAESLADQAVEALRSFGTVADPLRAAALFAVERRM